VVSQPDGVYVELSGRLRAGMGEVPIGWGDELPEYLMPEGATRCDQALFQMQRESKKYAREPDKQLPVSEARLERPHVQGSELACRARRLSQQLLLCLCLYSSVVALCLLCVSFSSVTRLASPDPAYWNWYAPPFSA
jgi:hypothetical protein